MVPAPAQCENFSNIHRVFRTIAIAPYGKTLSSFPAARQGGVGRQSKATLIRIKVRWAVWCDSDGMIASRPVGSVELPPPSGSRRLASFLPREHGSWALALEPLLLGWLAAPTWSGALLSVAGLAVFLARRPWQVARRPGDPERVALAWKVIVTLGVLAAVTGGAAVLAHPAAVVMAMALAAAGFLAFALLESRRANRQAVAECIGAGGFCACGAAVVLSGLGTGGLRLALIVAGFALVRSITSILPVRTFVRRRKGQVISIWSPVVASGATLAAVLAFQAQMGTWVPLFWTGVFFVRTCWLMSPWAPRWSARRVGILEMVLGLAAIISTGLSLS